MCVKNTFVHVDIPEEIDIAPMRRSSSVPRSARLSLSGPKRSCSPSPSAEASTDTDVSEADRESSGSLPHSPAFGPAIAEAEPPRQRLNSRAKAWTPGAPGSACLAQRFAVVVASAAASIRKDCAGLVEVSQSEAGWSLILDVPKLQRDQALSTAQRALAVAAQATSGIHLIGSTANPFSMTPFGCSAMLGAADESAACWNSLVYGYCYRGAACRWQHPTAFSSVSIAVLGTKP